MKIQPVDGDGGSSPKVVLPENEKSSRPPETAVSVLELYCQRSSRPPETAIAVLKLYYHNEKSSRPPEAVVPVLKKLYHQRTKIQPAAGDGGSSPKVVLPENDNAAGRRRRRLQI